MNLYFRLLRYIRPYRGRLILTFISSVIVGSIATSPVPLIQKTFDNIFIKKDITMLTFIPLVIILLYVVKGILSYIQNLLIQNILWSLIISIRKELYSHMHYLPVTFIEDDSSTGELMSRITYDIAIMQSSISTIAREFLQNFVMLLGLLIWVFYYKWDWAIISLIAFPISAFPISNISRKLRRLAHHAQEKMGEISNIIQESFSGIKIVRAFGMEENEIKRFSHKNDDFFEVVMKSVKYNEITSPLMEFLAVIGISLILWYGGYQVLNGVISSGTFFAFITGLLLMYNPARLLGKTYTKIQSSIAGAERVFSILDIETEIRKERTSKILPPFFDRIEYKDVSFRYPSRDEMVLKGINLTVRKGEVLAIIGPSGEGKTTMVDLLLRFYDPSEGKILIDSVDICEFSLKSVRRQIALVSQDIFLFNDTIRNNIRYGDPAASDEDVMRAAESAYVSNFAIEMEDGFDTIIGERGVKLSGGQRQRIAIARAILKDTPILILDEATSALDSESEKVVQDALFNLMANRTTFIIAHR
ncbi:MAG: ATP-binding cassette domain-containing protein, partial [Nitrospinae bacterium]|nr:ATP-binding cassette domain-containing protein [Nitrospinota bacterium]